WRDAVPGADEHHLPIEVDGWRRPHIRAAAAGRAVTGRRREDGLPGRPAGAGVDCEHAGRLAARIVVHVEADDDTTVDHDGRALDLGVLDAVAGCADIVLPPQLAVTRAQGPQRLAATEEHRAHTADGRDRGGRHDLTRVHAPVR